MVRAILADDPAQGRSARKLLTDATTIAVPLPCLCELVWILRRGAKLATADIAGAIRALVNTGNVAMNRPAVEAGLRLLEADGVIAYEGRWLGGETFMSFDRKAVALLSQQGEAAQLLS
ncbi:type II toxin-antitoxin system VapC family toxin [Methylobacterium sp. E-066]|nr:type II toxin-antitoxin system VapC family toxin [Methylobacterium sp. E-066]MCJ2141180.1 type II toxin-antitoxin system VapC family toxin [Methylobacterium sp. E-066]